MESWRFTRPIESDLTGPYDEVRTAVRSVDALEMRSRISTARNLELVHAEIVYPKFLYTSRGTDIWIAGLEPETFVRAAAMRM